jgi:hypothetical protein
MPFAASRVATGIAIAVATAALSFAAEAATLFSNRTLFLNVLSASLTDDYQNTAYDHPDNPNESFSDAAMGGIFGQAKYKTTGLTDRNIVERQGSQRFYCAGCNGSFRLDFTGTSIGPPSGVRAVGLNVIANQAGFPYVAFVTYGDGTTENFPLPVKNSQTRTPTTVFWGITSTKPISSIHFGGSGGAAVTAGSFALDNLTIGAPTDSDGDGVPDSVDNCIEVPNGPLIPDAGGASQRDTDGDGYGNLCDGDLNNSGFVTTIDYVMLRNLINQSAASSPEAAAADLNGSGLVTVTDYLLMRDMLNAPPGPSGLHH